MKWIKYGVNTGLIVVVILLAFWLTRIILDPIEFNKEFNVRQKATIEKLKNIRTAQKYYLQIYGEYSNSFDELIRTVKNDSIVTIKTIGDPEDTSIVVTYDTIMEAVMEVADFQGDFDPDKMRVIPYTDKEFSIESGHLEKQRVTIPVFRIVAQKEDYLTGLNKKYIKEKKDLQVGSLREGTDSGNWE